MNKIKKKIFTNLAIILLVVGMAIFVRQNLFIITDVFIQIEKADAQATVNLINENWKGITTYTDKQKKALVINLSPEYAAVGLESMRSICVILVYVMSGSWILIILSNIIQLYRKNRSNNKIKRMENTGVIHE